MKRNVFCCNFIMIWTSVKFLVNADLETMNSHFSKNIAWNIGPHDIHFPSEV
jgi:hypothetical protein